MERRRPLQAADRCWLAAAGLTAAAFEAATDSLAGLGRGGGKKTKNLTNRLPCFGRKEETENFAEQLLIDFVSARFVCLPTDPGGDGLPRRSDFLF